ncbi:uncharacterized protein LOC141844391 [Curcuma longa]|uniref:uncharacterized protein LOC141844391 n=1 Tax=Curcuma longa TaxID=136217 RepID=UPI003D9F8E26
MPNDECGKVKRSEHEDCPEACLNWVTNHSEKDASPSQNGVIQKRGGVGAALEGRHMGGAVHLPTVGMVISHPEDGPDPNTSISKLDALDDYERINEVATATAAATFNKVSLPRSESFRDQCRVCQQHQTEEPLIDLGCGCRGELAKVHRTCIEIWFRTKGSNKCEICQQVASNVPFPESHPSTNYRVWRVNSVHGRAQRENGRVCLNPLWVAFALLIGGLFLDVLVSVSLGISSLPVNVITGVLIVLGLAAALRLSMECCTELGATSDHVHTDITSNPLYHPGV